MKTRLVEPKLVSRCHGVSFCFHFLFAIDSVYETGCFLYGIRSGMTQPSPINISAEDDSSTFQNKKEGEGSDGGGQLEFQQD